MRVALALVVALTSCVVIDSYPMKFDWTNP